MSKCITKTTVKRTFLWLIIIAGLSSFVTYHIGMLLPWAEDTQIEVQHHVWMNRVLMKEVVHVDSVLVGQGLERKDPDIQRHQNSQVSDILARLKQVSFFHSRFLYWCNVQQLLFTGHYHDKLTSRRTVILLETLKMPWAAEGNITSHKMMPYS